VKSPPGRSVPESKTPGSVAVCALFPVFVQQTVVPTGTVSVSGKNTKSCISTTVVP